MTIKKDH